MPKKTTKSNSEKRALTPEQRVFCRLVAIEKLKPSQAYMQVFKCKPNSASTMAGVFLKRIEIQNEIQRLQASIQLVQEKTHIWTKAERMERLQEWAQESAGAGDIPTAIKCVDTLNKMDGAYETKVSTEQQSVREQREMAEERADRMKRNILQVIYEQRERAGSSSHIDRELRA